MAKEKTMVHAGPRIPNVNARHRQPGHWPGNHDPDGRAANFKPASEDSGPDRTGPPQLPVAREIRLDPGPPGRLRLRLPAAAHEHALASNRTTSGLPRSLPPHVALARSVASDFILQASLKLKSKFDSSRDCGFNAIKGRLS
jgi:hypothetical protein